MGGRSRVPDDSRRTIIIGDLHGCRDELDALLQACERNEDDVVISVGDLVAKGPDSRGVVDFIRSINAKAVLGNHDAHVVDSARLSLREARERGREHHRAVADELAEDNLAWLQQLPLTLSLPGAGVDGGDVLVVHAGLVPGVPLAKQERKHLLHLRSIRHDGFPSSRIEGRPWGSLWSGPEHVVFGHDAVRGLQKHAHATGLDTGCVYGKKLTALILPEARLVSVDARRAYAG